MIEVTFSPEDVDVFAAASGDVNPLHVSEAYARGTPYGRRVVHGILATLAAIGHLPERQDAALETISLDFLRPVFIGVGYSLEIQARENRVSIKLRDGSLPVLRGKLTFRPATPHAPQPAWVSVSTPGPEPDLSLEDIDLRQHLDFSYGPVAGPFAALLDRLTLRTRGLREDQVAALMACSYLVGMRMPGRRALFSSATLAFQPCAPSRRLTIAAHVTDKDERFESVQLSVTVSAGGPLATAELKTFVRRAVPDVDPKALAASLPPSAALAGKVALVVGGSRGLGAAIAVSLAQQGCTVLSGFSRSAPAADRLGALGVAGQGRVTALHMDAANLDACVAACAEIEHTRGGIDVLILNACPPLLPLAIEPATAGRIVDFVRDAVSLVSHPLSACLGSLVARRGTLVVISSAAVDDPPRDWPHYVAAKCAVEGLISGVAAAHPELPILVARPPRLRTGLTNTVMGWQGALPVEDAAAVIVRAALSTQPGLTVLTTFQSV